MIRRSFDALLLDLDGTLVTDDEEIRPRTLQALRQAASNGARVMVATGRSELATVPVLDVLGLESPAIVFNGAGLWCTRTRRLVEERVLSQRAIRRAVAIGQAHGFLTVAMCAGVKYALRPRGDMERLALRDMTGIEFAEVETLEHSRAIRMTLFSDRHADSGEFAREVEREIAQPLYLTHFPLNVLAHHRESRLQVVDLHPPCRGKAEALRVLQEWYGIEPERVVAVGDATNDISMFQAAGLSVCMGSGMAEAQAAAQRVIGDNNSDAIAELVEELFL
jgi:5-amino-6-(5-phospho-D-ribitylamino)uracil phosphatase